MATTKFSSRDLVRMLKDLGGLVSSPIGRQMLAEQLEGTIRRSKIGGSMLDKVKLMYTYFRDPAEPAKSKIMIGAALLYLVIPNDLIPDWFGLVGFADDFAAIAFVWNQMKDVLMNYETRRLKRMAAQEGLR